MAPRGNKTIALKARAILSEGNLYDLFVEELWITREETQRVIDVLWSLDRIPSLSQVHQLFYYALRSKGFGSHHAKQIYKYALALVKSARKRGGSKPTLKKLSVRLDKHDINIDFNSWIVTVKLRNKAFKFRLLHRRSYLEKFKYKRWFELIIKWLPKTQIEIVICFRFEYNPYTPKRILSLNLNLRQLTLFDGKHIRRIKTRYLEALKLKQQAEETQKKTSLLLE